jgi:putative ABC transport system ATP-binding protein
MTPPVVLARNLRRTYGTGDNARTVVSGISLTVPAGEWVAVMGRSGCGKSTLLHLLGGLDVPTAGSVQIAGTVISSRGESARARFRRRHIGYVFQQYNLIDDLTVAGNVELPLLLAGHSRRAARRRARALLARVGLEGRATATPARLSGGEQQRVAIMRALASEPSLLLADEPTGALDSETAAIVVDLLVAARRQGQTIVMVTHDQAVAAAADRIVEMTDGRVVPLVSSRPLEPAQVP